MIFSLGYWHYMRPPLAIVLGNLEARPHHPLVLLVFVPRPPAWACPARGKRPRPFSPGSWHPGEVGIPPCTRQVGIPGIGHPPLCTFVSDKLDKGVCSDKKMKERNAMFSTCFFQHANW